MSVTEVRAAPAGLPSQESLEELVSLALAEASKQGASAAEAGVSVDIGLSVNVRQGEVDTLEHERDRSLGVTVYFGQRTGSASSSDFRRDSIIETVQAACAIARHTSEDPCQGLADPDLLAREFPDLDLYHPWELDAEDAIRLARECEAVALATDPRISNSDGAGVATQSGVRVYGNSNDFLAGYKGSRHSLSCRVVGKEGDAMQRSYWYTTSRVAEALEDAASVGRIAAERTLRRLGARRLSTRTAPVLYAPEVARGLLGHFIAAISGGALYRKASFLLDQLGQPVFPEFVHIEEQPHRPRGLGSAAFDGEGVATKQRVLVDAGVLQGYVLSSYSARKLGLRSTGNAGGVRNLIVQPGELDFEGLLSELGTGLVVTELMGQGVNTTTGDYSRGASGFWVENGEIAYPVEEITVAGNLRDMFQRLRAVGNDVDFRGNILTGSLLIDDMTIAGE